MIPRYSRPEMVAIWSPETRFRIWFEIEAHACDALAEIGVIPKDQAEKLCIVCGVFIHWEAKDDKKIFEYNYKATKESIARALKGEPKSDEVTAKKDTAKHPFSGV